MTRSGWIEPKTLSSDQRRAIVAVLEKKHLGTAEGWDEILRRIERRWTKYSANAKSAGPDSAADADRLDALARVADDFIAALDSTDHGELIEHAGGLGRGALSQIRAEAERIAAGAREIAPGMRRKRGEHRAGPGHAFVYELALDFESVFRKTPSPAEGGLFQTLAQTVVDQLGIEAPTSKSALKKILGRK